LTAAGMTHLHIDYYTGQTGTFRIFLISPPSETSYNLTIPTTGWSSMDIPLSAFSGVNLAQVLQIKFDNSGGANFTDSILIDNIYFYKNATTATGPSTPAPTPTTPTANVKSIYSDTYTNITVNEWGPDWGPSSARITDFPISGNATKVIDMAAGKTFAGIDFAPSKFNATTYTHIKMDYWIPAPIHVGQVLSIKLSNHDGAGETNALETTVTSIQAGQWVTLDIPLANFTPINGASRNNMAQIIISAARADGNLPLKIYIDNIYFYNTGSSSAGLNPAPTPTRASTDVISIFSDAYTNVAGTDLNPGWGQATAQSVFPISGNNTMKYKTLNYQGIQFGSAQNLTAAGMTHLHIDFLTPQSGTLRMFLISTGPVETPYSLTIPTSGWTSLDIPLSSFSPVNLADVIQIKFDNGTGALPSFTDSVLIDNIYFYKQTVVLPPPTAPSIVGTWKLRPVAAALGVGPTRGDISWFSSTLDDIATRNCQFDDLYVFDSTGKFTNILQSATWLEAWQGKDPAGCGAPVAPHNGSIPATYTYNSTTNTLTLKGKGAHIGVAKATNGGDLTSPSSAPDSIRYILSNIMDTTMTVELNFGTGWWKYLLVKTANVVVTPPPPPTPIAFPFTFESNNQNFVFVHVGKVITSFGPNPDKSGMNTTEFVTKVTKQDGAGKTDHSYIQLSQPLDLPNGSIMKMHVWSPLAFIKVRVRLINSTDPTKFIDVEQLLTTPNSWQELEFILPKLKSGVGSIFDRFAVIFDADNLGNGSSFYYDNVMLKLGTSGISNANGINVFIYPNPAQNSLTLESDKIINAISIYNLVGQEVYSHSANQRNLTIDIHSLSKGNYILKTVTKDGEMHTKLTKE
jgi:hypothetical protein